MVIPKRVEIPEIEGSILTRGSHRRATPIGAKPGSAAPLIIIAPTTSAPELAVSVMLVSQVLAPNSSPRKASELALRMLCAPDAALPDTAAPEAATAARRSN